MRTSSGCRSGPSRRRRSRRRTRRAAFLVVALAVWVAAAGEVGRRDELGFVISSGDGSSRSRSQLRAWLRSGPSSLSSRQWPHAARARRPARTNRHGRRRFRGDGGALAGAPRARPQPRASANAPAPHPGARGGRGRRRRAGARRADAETALGPVGARLAFLAAKAVALSDEATAPCAHPGRPDGAPTARATAPCGSGACACERRGSRLRRSSGSRVRRSAASESISRSLPAAGPRTRSTNAFERAASGRLSKNSREPRSRRRRRRPLRRRARRGPRAGSGRARAPGRACRRRRGRAAPAFTIFSASPRISSSLAASTRNVARSRRAVERGSGRGERSSSSATSRRICSPLRPLRGAARRPRSFAPARTPNAVIRRSVSRSSSRSPSRSSSRSPAARSSASLTARRRESSKASAVWPWWSTSLSYSPKGFRPARREASPPRRRPRPAARVRRRSSPAAGRGARWHALAPARRRGRGCSRGGCRRRRAARRHRGRR